MREIASLTETRALVGQEAARRRHPQISYNLVLIHHVKNSRADRS